MTQQKKIQEILSQKNYQVTNGKVLRYDMMDDKFKPVIVSGNRIPLVKDGEIVEIFAWDEVVAAMDGLHTNGKLPESVVEDDRELIRKNEFSDYGIIQKNKDGELELISTKKLMNKDGAAKLPDDFMTFDKVGVIDKDGNIKNIPSLKGASPSEIVRAIKDKKVKPKKEVMTKEKTVKKLKKVIEKVTKKTAPKKPSTRKAYKTGLHRGNLSKENIEFIQNEARKEKGMTVADMAKKFGVGRLTVDHHWKKAAKWVKTKVLIPQKKAKK